MNLVIAGNLGGTNVSGSFFRACKKEGIPAEFFNMSEASSKYKVFNSFCWRLLDRRYPWMAKVNRMLETYPFEKDALLVTSGLCPIEGATIKRLKLNGIRCVNFLTDDPWNPSHRSNWSLRALKEYHIIFTPRRANIRDLESLGCARVVYMPFGYDEELFHPITSKNDTKENYDLFFAGGADGDRLPLIHSLIAAGLQVRLYGDYWERYVETRANYCGYAQPGEVRRGFAEARLSLILVRRANRDGHVMRSYEAAACKGCLLVEDTPEHREIYGEGEGVVEYFSTAREMLEKAKFLIACPQIRSRMREAVFKKIVIDGKNTYSARIKMIVQETLKHLAA